MSTAGRKIEIKKREHLKCEQHGKRKSQCLDCGTGYCAHKKQKYKCKTCKVEKDRKVRVDEIARAEADRHFNIREKRILDVLSRGELAVPTMGMDPIASGFLNLWKGCFSDQMLKRTRDAYGDKCAESLIEIYKANGQTEEEMKETIDAQYAQLKREKIQVEQERDVAVQQINQMKRIQRVQQEREQQKRGR